MTIKNINYYKKSYTLMKVVSIPAFLVGFYLLFNTSLLIINGIETKGKVIDVKISKTDDEILYNPIIEYNVENHSYTFTPLVTIDKNELPISSIVNIIYNEDNIKDVEINSFFYLWTPTIMSFLIPLVLISMGYIFYQMALKSNKT